MNKIRKYFSALIIACMVVGGAHAAAVSERASCADIQVRINELSAIKSPTDAQSSELTSLQAQYRSDCSRSATGRRNTSTGRVSASSAVVAAAPAVTTVVETVVMTAQSALDEYLTGRQNLCNELKSDIDTLIANGVSDTDTEPLQNQYDADCNEIDKSKSVQVDAETAARNVASGLCEDGSKPNQFGCCEGETFTDMGNLVFACCPDDGGTCYPPINDGNAL